MYKRAIAGFAALLSAGAALAGSPEDEVRDLAFAMADAIARSDAERAALLSPDFIAIDPRGGTRRVREFVSDVRARPRDATLAKLRREWSGLATDVNGNEAAFVGRATWVPVMPRGERATRSVLYTQRWRLAGGRWQLVQLQSVALPAPPELAEIPSGALRLKAMLFRPPGAGPFPAIVYAHGNEPDPADLLETVGPALAARGYLVVGVHRRGSGLSADQGPNLLRRLTEIEQREGVEARSRAALAALEGGQLDDIAAAIAYAKTSSDVDGNRVFVIGNSFGGVLALLAAERGLGLRGAADFAGAALNWERSEFFRERLSRAASNARIPVFLGQAENDFSTTPTRELARILAAARRPHRARKSFRHSASRQAKDTALAWMASTSG